MDRSLVLHRKIVQLYILDATCTFVVKEIFSLDLVAKVTKKIIVWHSRILNFGSKTNMIKHVLQSIRIHTMSTSLSPKTTMRYIKRSMVDSTCGGIRKKNYHWASLDMLFFPFDEGGIGIRRIEDVCISLRVKQLWIFKTRKTL